jgi:hypothetical protein
LPFDPIEAVVEQRASAYMGPTFTHNFFITSPVVELSLVSSIMAIALYFLLLLFILYHAFICNVFGLYYCSVIKEACNGISGWSKSLSIYFFLQLLSPTTQTLFWGKTITDFCLVCLIFPMRKPF